jgi:hypothetical protein
VPLDRLGFPALTVSHRPEYGVECVEWDLRDGYLMEKRRGTGWPRLGGLPQPPPHYSGSARADARRAPDTQPLGETREDAHAEGGRGVLAMQQRALWLRAIALAGDARSLAPGLTTGRAMGADVAAAAPAPGGTTGGGAKVRVGGDRAWAASGEGEHGWRRPGRRGTRIGSQLTGRAKRFVDQAGARLGGFGTSASRPLGLKGCMRHTGGGVAHPDLEKPAAQDESDQEAMGKQRFGCHGGVPFALA